MQSRGILTSALQTGKIKKNNCCAKCGKRCVTDCHHLDYQTPLTIIELCHKCHMSLHAKIGFQKELKTPLRKKITFFSNEFQMKKLKKMAKEKDLPYSMLIRMAIKDFLHNK